MYGKAEAVYREALERYEKSMGSQHPSTIHVMSSLASVLQDQCEYTSAEGMHRRSLTACHALFGEENPETLTTMESLASILQDQG